MLIYGKIGFFEHENASARETLPLCLKSENGVYCLYPKFFGRFI